MAFGNRQSSRPAPGIIPGASDELISDVSPAKIDEMLLDALDALEQTRKLHETTANPEIKRRTRRILNSLHSSLLQLAPLGVHSTQRLARVPLGP